MTTLITIIIANLRVERSLKLFYSIQAQEVLYILDMYISSL